MDLIMI